ncbi:MAG: carbamoyltransferase HypF, partial [Terriglobales bacterium]
MGQAGSPRLVQRDESLEPWRGRMRDPSGAPREPGAAAGSPAQSPEQKQHGDGPGPDAAAENGVGQCAAPAPRAARRWVISGQVQGVGFRPLVCRLARELGLGGRVWNDGHGVMVEAEGPEAELAEWERRLRRQAVAPVRIATIASEPIAVRGLEAFEISPSRDAVPGPDGTASAPAGIPPDLAICEECLRELADPANRRYQYPFLNCTHCGPRYTIIGGLPYDRPRTTMAAFAMCPACQAEYHDPADRRFHAQPNACPDCGPQLTLQAADGEVVKAAAALAAARRRLAAGEVVAIKGLGGFHLACDAANATAVARLRRAKRRGAKPFAVMVADLAGARALAEISAAEAALLTSPRRPIVILKRRPQAAAAVTADVAPDQATLGILLPYTPLHHLLLAPPGPMALVMTSGNRGEEPLAIADAQAEGWLREPEARLAQAVLGHNRSIRYRADDSVARVIGGAARLIRRGRGYAPEPLDLGQPGPPVVGLGAESKNTCCLTLDHFAVLGPHVGDWDRYETEAAYAAVVENLLSFGGVQPQAVGYDPHPGYAVSAWGRRRFAGLPQFPVQHHHAHIAAVLAEHRHPGPVIGLAWDGTGWGPDGTIWGGEVLVADRRQYTRWAHLSHLPLPGGDQAVREPWRMALAAAWAAGGGEGGDGGWARIAGLERALNQVPAACRGGVAQLLARNYPMAQTSSCGRLFDAVAALAGLGGEASFEGQLAAALEMAAGDADADQAQADGSDPEVYAIPLCRRAPDADGPPRLPWQLDTRPLLRAVMADVARGQAAGVIAARFHAALAQAAVAVCWAVRARTGIGVVALGGGSWQNARLLALVMDSLEAAGFQVLAASEAPVNDGGLALGQAAVAQALWAERQGNATK